jgi:hypothetical protein
MEHRASIRRPASIPIPSRDGTSGARPAPPRPLRVLIGMIIHESWSMIPERSGGETMRAFVANQRREVIHGLIAGEGERSPLRGAAGSETD